MSVRRVVVAIAFGAMIAGAIGAPFIRVVIAAWRDPGVLATLLPDRRAPEYASFLEAVAAHVPPGSRVGLLAPDRRWHGGYDYFYYRASYFLAHARVIPLLDRDNRWHAERLAEVDLVAAWRMAPPRNSGEVVWRGAGGVLVRRNR